MIEGLQVDVKSAELKKIIASRIEYHQAKCKVLETTANKLRTTMIGIEDDMEEQMSKVRTNNSPTQGLDNQAKQHKDKVVHFQFLLDHVVQDDVYRLTQSDLQLLGIYKPSYY